LLIDVWSPMKVIRGDRARAGGAGQYLLLFVGGLLHQHFYLVRMYFTSVRRRALLQAAIAIGIGLGSLQRDISRGEIEYG